jgi:hypothetical protein
MPSKSKVLVFKGLSVLSLCDSLCRTPKADGVIRLADRCRWESQILADALKDRMAHLALGGFPVDPTKLAKMTESSLF